MKPAEFSKLSPLGKLGFGALYMCGAATTLYFVTGVWTAFFKLVGL